MKRMNKIFFFFFSLVVVTLVASGFSKPYGDNTKQETVFNYCNQVPNESLFHQAEWGDDYVEINWGTLSNDNSLFVFRYRQSGTTTWSYTTVPGGGSSSYSGTIAFSGLIGNATEYEYQVARECNGVRTAFGSSNYCYTLAW